MTFPVDLLANVDSEALELSAKDYMSKLLYQSPEIQESLKLPDSKEIGIGLCNVSFVPLYGHNIEQKILALFPQDEFFTAVGLYLLGSWWSAEDILRTADPKRTGLLEVRTVGERIVLYVLNRIIYRTKEKDSDDRPFLCHTEHETAKILWKDGEAIGFYSVKPEGTLCKRFLTQCYGLPVMDTAFIRRCHRGKGYGLQMLEDFMRTFRNDHVGLKYPLPAAMYKVCKNHLSTCPADKERLWEVHGVGNLYERTLIFKKLQTMEFKGDHQFVGKLIFESENTDVPVEKGQKTTEYTVVEVVDEEVQIKFTKEVQDTPVTTRGRSSSRLKRKKLGVDTGASTDKMIRVEDIEARVQSPVHEPTPKAVRSSLNVKETDLRDTTITVPHSEPTILDFTCSRCEQQKKRITESEKYELDVSDPPRPSAEPATAPPEEAVEKTELQITVSEIKSMESNEETLIVKSVETTSGATDIQHSELVEVEIVKMTPGTEVMIEKNEDVEGAKEVTDKGEDKISETTFDAKVKCNVISPQKSSQQTELDLTTDTMGSEQSSSTEMRTLRSSSTISTTAAQQKSTHLHKELKVASKLSTARHTSAQRNKAVEQGESGQAVDQPANLEIQEIRNEVQMEEKAADIINDVNKARLSEQELREEIKVLDPEVALLQRKDIEIHGEKMIVEEISQEGAEVQKGSDTEVREESAAEPAEVEESDASEELLQLEQAISEETEESNKENMEIEQRSVAANEAGVLQQSVMEVVQTEQVQGQETIKDTSIIQDSECEERKRTKTQVLGHDNDAMTSNWTKSTEENISEKADNSERHAGCSGRFTDQSAESELTSRVLRSGTKLVGTVSKHMHVQHTKTVNQQEKTVQTSDKSEKGGEIETMGITSIEYNTNLYIETELTPEKDFKEVEDVAQTQTTRDVPKIVIVDLEAMNDDDILVEGKKAGQSDAEPIEVQEKEPPTEMARAEDGQNVVVPTKENAEDVVTEEILQFQDSRDQELAELARTKTDREESREDGEKAKETEALIEPAEKEHEDANETSVETVQSEVSDELIKASVAEKEDVLAELMMKTNSDQEENMSAEEKVKYDEVEALATEEGSVVTKLHTSENKTNQKEVQSMTPISEVTVEDISPEEETPVITSRSLRQRTVPVKSPPQRKSQRFQKPKPETAEHDNTEMVEVEDKTVEGRVEEAEEDKNEKMETEDGAFSKHSDRVPESANPDQGLMEVTQEEEQLMEAKTFVIEDDGKSGCVGEKSADWTESDGEEDSDKADTSGKPTGSRRSKYATPLRRSGRFKDPSLEGELTKRVLRSGTKLSTSVSEQKHKRHTKPVKQQEKSGRAGNEFEKQGEMETMGITSVEDRVHVPEIVMDIEPEIEAGELVEEKEEETATEMAQKGDGQNMMNIPSVDVPPEQTSTSGTSEERLQPCKEVGQELEKLACTEQGRDEHNEETEPLVEPVEKSWNETHTETSQPQEEEEQLNNVCTPEKGAEEPMIDSQKELVMELDADTSMKNSKQGERILTDDRVGETSLNEEYIAAVAINTAEVCVSESEKIQKEDQEIIKPGHGETVQENVPGEEPPVITSRSLRRRTVMAKSRPQRKSKHLQKSDVEMTENVTISDVMEEIKDKTSETDQNSNEKMAEVTSISNDADKVPEGQMEVVLEEELAKESSTQQEIPPNEETMIKETHESGQSDKTAVPDTNLAEVVKDADTEEEFKALEELAAEPAKEHPSDPEMAVGPGGQNSDEATTTGLKLQKTSVVLVDFNKAPPKQTAEIGTSTETALPHDEVRQEQDKPASISSYVEERKYEEDVTNQKEACAVPAEQEQAEKEMVGVEEVKDGSKGTSEEKDETIDEMMVIEEGVVKVQVEDSGKAITVQGIQGDAEKEAKDTQERRRAGAEERSDTHVVQPEEENLGKRGKAHATGKQTEQSAVETPVRGSRQPTDQHTTMELATRILRSSTKQVQTTSIQRNTQQAKAIVQRDKSGQALDKADEYKKKTKEGPSEPAKEDKLQTVSVITEGTTVLQDIKLIEGVSHSEHEEMEVEIMTELFPQQNRATTEDMVLKEATEATTNEEKKSDLHEAATDVEVETEGRVRVQTMAETAEEQAEGPVKEIAQKEESLSVFTLQRAAVLLVDFNKVPHKQTTGIEATEETVQSGEEAEIEEEWKQDQHVAESAEKEATSETETSVHGVTQLQEQDVFHKTDGSEIEQELVDIGVEKSMTQSLQKPVVGEEMLKEDSEQEKDTVDISETELEVLQETAEKGEAGVKESDDVENGAVASDTAFNVEVESTSAEELKLKLSEVKTTEVEHTEENTDPGKELQMMPSTSLATVVVEATSESEERAENEVEKKTNAEHTKHHLTKPAQGNTNEESSEEEETIITKNLRRRTVIVESSERRRSTRLCREVVKTHEKVEVFVEASSQRETMGSIEATRMAEQVKIAEPKSKDDREYGEIACELMSKVITLDDQGGKNIPVITVETVETTDIGEEAVAEKDPGETVEERTESAVCEEVEVRDLTDLTDSPVKDPELDSGQQENVLDITEELSLEEKSKGESRLVEKENQLLEKEGMGNISTTAEMLDEIDVGAGVERRSLRKRTITIKATTEGKSKRMRKKGVEHTESLFSVEEPVVEQIILTSTREKETTGQKDQKAVVDDDKAGGILSEKDQDHEGPAGEGEATGETSTSADNQVNMLEDETGKYGENADNCDTVEEIEDQDLGENQKNRMEHGGISFTSDDSSFTFELDEKDENDDPKPKVREGMGVSLRGGKHLASTPIQKSECEKHFAEEEEEHAGKKQRAPAGRSSATATSEQRSARGRKRFVQEKEMEGMCETKVAKEVAETQEGKPQTLQKRKVLPETPRRSKRLTTPKSV